MPLNLTFDPAILEVVIKPGGGLTQAYTVTNNSDTSVSLVTSVVPFVPAGTDGSVSYDHAAANPHLSFSLMNADLPLNQSFFLHPGEKKQLVLKIKTDSNTPQTDSYYTFFVSQDQASGLGTDSGSAALARLGSHLLISVSDTASPEISATVSGFKLSSQFHDFLFSPLTFSGLIDNGTDFFFHTDGRLTVYKNGLEIQKWNLMPQNVLAHHSRDIQCADTDFHPVACTLNPPFWPGAYTATLASNGSNASITFFVLPYSLVAFLLLLTGLYALLRTFLRPKSKSA